MAYSYQKIQIAILILAITAIGSLQADSSSSIETCNETYVSDSCCSNNCGLFFIDANLLYLRTYQGGLTNWCDSVHITNSKEHGLKVSRLKGKTHEPHLKWNLGFRAGLGYEFADRNSDIGAYWTHYHSRSKGSKSPNNKHKWQINFDVLDLLYGYEFCYSTCLTITPFAGLRYAKIDQKLRTKFISTTTNTHATSSNSSNSSDRNQSASKGNLKEKFSGVGPLFGIEGDIGLGCNLSLYGDISLALLYGTFHVRSHTTHTCNKGKNINHLKKHLQAYQTVLDAGFGIRWESCFCNNKLLLVQLGVEQHRYFNQNQLHRYGDLILDGISIGAGIEF